MRWRSDALLLRFHTLKEAQLLLRMHVVFVAGKALAQRFLRLIEAFEFNQRIGFAMQRGEQFFSRNIARRIFQNC